MSIEDRPFFRRSLRVWLAAGFIAALIPLCLFAVLGYGYYHRVVVEPIRTVLQGQNAVLVPLERVQGEMWELEQAVNRLSQSGSAAADIAEIESRVAGHLVQLQSALDEHGQYAPIISDLNLRWSDLIAQVAAVAPGTPEAADPAVLAVDADLSAMARDLELILEDLRVENVETHAAILRATHAIEIGALIAGLVALVMVALGIWIINRSLVLSTDRLVAGALRAASGDRDRPIDVRVPSELAAVADAFNDLVARVVEQETRLERMAHSDPLTGLGNRRAFDMALDEAAAHSLREAEPLAVLMIDVDRFKLVNDTHGHIGGDLVLSAIGEVLGRVARSADDVFRYGGEEFAVLLRDVSGPEAMAVAERVRTSVAETQILMPDGSMQTVTVSVGAAVASGRTGAGEALLAEADAALYRAKGAGRNRVLMAA